jgi:hypothetical protein
MDNHSGGWLAQYSDTGANIGDLFGFRLLTSSLGDIPVVFNSFSSGARLVEAFFPDPPPGFIWHERGLYE